MLASITALYAKSDSKASAQMTAKIWDSTDGQMVFEAVRSGDDVSIFSGPPYHKAVKVATENLLKSLIIVYGQH